MNNTRPEFLARLDVLVAAFEKANMPKDWIPLQLMNDFPQWTNEEMDSVAAKTGVERSILQYVYDSVYNLVREPVRVAQTKLKSIEDMLAKANETKAEKRDRATDEAHKRAAEGASFANSWLDDMLRRQQARKQAPPPPKPPPRQQYNGAFGDWAAHFANFSTSGAHAGKPWASAPGYIQNACATLEVAWPSTAEAAKKQYHAKAKKAHPDAGGKVEDFKKVQEAWELLEQYFTEHK